MNTSVLAAPAQLLTTPSIAYHALMPIFIVLGAALLGLLVEAFVPRGQRFGAQVFVTVGGLVAGLVAVGLLHGTHVTTPSPAGNDPVFAGTLAIDGTGLFLQGTILALAIMAALLIAERSVDVDSAIVASAATVVGSPAERRASRAGRVQTEVFPLLLFAVSGMLIYPVSNNLLIMFVALEVLSLPLYLMAGLARRRRLLSQEAALKYFLLGAFSSAFFLYGLALLYGYANSVDLAAIFHATRTSTHSDVLLYVGLALLRVLYVAFSSTNWNWRPIIWAVAIASMIVGSVLGLTQTDVKRILAYSSVAHAGFILVGLVVVSKAASASVLFYVLTYGFTTMAAFGTLMLVRDAEGEATHLSQWSGIARKSPVVASVMTLLLLSMAGIPLTAGFTGKFFVFRSAWHSAGPLVVMALLFSAVSAFYYLRIVVMMYFAEPPENGPTVAIPGWTTSVALTCGVVVTIVLGVFPQPVLDLATKAAGSLIG
jgi:NADH-quinone oxidoreductase subunit N